MEFGAADLRGMAALGLEEPADRETANTQVLAFDPDQPVFLFPEIARNIEALRRPDTGLCLTIARAILSATPDVGTMSELARRRIHIVGTFALGPDFTTDGTVIISDRNFLKLFRASSSPNGELADVEFGVIKVRPVIQCGRCSMR